ncbi:MAG TPA: rhomboid family intramembrane serine protease [Solirubrobacteraceae bacterium]|nr:rhomboid family intramembrane serine protease [Solirubrobacteraceae bacterium]
MATCYRHTSRETGVSCSNCGRPICPDCMTTTPVGMRCPECAKQSTKVVRMRELAKVPQVTYALIVINVAAFFAEGNLSIGSQPTSKVYEEGALLGSIRGLPNLGVAHGQWWRIVTGGFLHENLLHIGFNMYVLYILGLQLEPALGRVRFASIYAVSLLTGSLGALLVSPHVVTVGASGAVFGIMGAFAVELRARNLPIMRGGLGGVGGLIVINLVISFTLPGISWGGHIGGLVGGTLAAMIIQLGERMRAQALAFAGCALIAAAAVAGSIATAKSSEAESVGAGGLTVVSPEP